MRRLIGARCIVVLIGAGVLASAHAGSAGAGAYPCAKVASRAGSDASPGTAERPFRTAKRLAASLAAGETGCLRAGEYVEDEITLRVARTGLTSYPGERARLVGRLRITGARVTVSRLALDGRNSRNLPSPTIAADGVVFRGNDVSSPGGVTCFILGSTGRVKRPVIQRNRIHDCGDELTEHGIYMEKVNFARILGNAIYDNADRGIKVGPDAQRSLIRGNVIDGNAIGLNFSGDREAASSYNVVERNVIAYSRRWWNVQSYWPGDRVGVGNQVRFNCLHGGNANAFYNRNGGLSGGSGFNAHDNLVAKPRYVDRARKDFRLRPDSPCLRVFARNAAPRCTITGTRRNDVLAGTGGRDIVCGRGGNDTLRGRAGNDVLVGGRGNDRLVGGAGRDRLVGGPGKDALAARDRTADTLAGGRGVDRARVDRGRGRDRVRGVEIVF